MAKLSVIIPTYNRSALVVTAVESVLAQKSNHDIEVIVIDDGSKDDTRAALSPFSERVRYTYQANAGMNAARNAGIRQATGTYIAFLDSDDAWLPFKADLQIDVMEKTPEVGFAFSDFFLWRGDTRTPKGLQTWMTPGLSIEQFASRQRSSADLGLITPAPFEVYVCEIHRLSLYQPVVLPSTSILRRSVVEALGPLPEDNWMCGDWEYFAHASKRFGAAYMAIETALNRSHDDAVRLMRRALADRTRQRIDSIRRTWRADAQFMASFAAEVDRVESKEWQRLFKLTCYAGDTRAARSQLDEIENLASPVPPKLRLLWWLVHLPLGTQLIAALRGRGN